MKKRIPLRKRETRVRPAITGLALAAALLSASCSSLSCRDHAGPPPAGDSSSHGVQIALAAARATTVAAVRQPVTTTRLGLAQGFLRGRELVSSNLAPGPDPFPLSPEVPGSRAFEDLLDREGMPPALPGSLRCLVDGPGFFPEFERLAAQARSSIDVQVYIFDTDDIGVRCAGLLRGRSSGIPVRVLVDDIGTAAASNVAPATPAPPGFSPPADMVAHLRAGSRVRARRILNPWLVADHTKLLVFDNKTALLGGMNLGREYHSEWHDLMVRLDGPVVAALAGEFEEAWRQAGPCGDLAFLCRPEAGPPLPARRGDIPLRLLRTDSGRARHQIMKAILLAIRASRDRIWVETPYFASDEISRALQAAARRGVDVRVVLPRRGNSNLMDVGNFATARELIESGAQVCQYPGMTHAKVMICDGWATLGSANLDTLSLRINRELNVAFSDPGTIRHLEQALFVPDLGKSRRMTLEETDVPMARWAEAIADQL